MKQSVTQKLDYGCGIACLAYVCGMTFEQAVKFLGKEYSVKHGWRPSDLANALNRYGFSYKNTYVRKKHDLGFPNYTIVLIERSGLYPVGHYLVLYENQWMDPWINMHENNMIQGAKSGYRTKLPGQAMYAIIPT